jgi:cold shock protein
LKHPGVGTGGDGWPRHRTGSNEGGQHSLPTLPVDDGGKDVFVHIRVVHRAGMEDLKEGQKLAFEVVADRKTGKSSAENLRAI